MASVNRAIILGHLGADPDVRASQSGAQVGVLSIATSRRFKDKAGQPIDETEWHRVVVFGRTAEIAKEYAHKGDPIYIEGRLHTRKWQDKDGKDRWTTEIVCENLQLLKGRESSGESGSEPARQPTARPAAQPQQPAQYDDVPF